ncbi:hypothetical protein D3C72_2390870 [compost metagenome]
MITGGLEVGDKVIVSGQQKVKEGAPAKAVPFDPNAGQQQPGAKPAAAPAPAEKK